MKKFTLIVATILATAFVAPMAATAASNKANAPGQNKDALIAVASVLDPTGSPTPGGVVKNLGGAISGWFFGNTSNAGIDSDAPDSGHGVTPSISPGPKTVGGNFCTLGDAMHAGGNC